MTTLFTLHYGLCSHCTQLYTAFILVECSGKSSTLLSSLVAGLPASIAYANARTSGFELTPEKEVRKFLDYKYQMSLLSSLLVVIHRMSCVCVV